jgi:hypothetical protein
MYSTTCGPDPIVGDASRFATTPLPALFLVRRLICMGSPSSFENHTVATKPRISNLAHRHRNYLFLVRYGNFRIDVEIQLNSQLGHPFQH